jgi:hypothetical protein
MERVSGSTERQRDNASPGLTPMARVLLAARNCSSARLGVDVKAILSPPCVLCMENY